MFYWTSYSASETHEYLSYLILFFENLDYVELERSLFLSSSGEGAVLTVSNSGRADTELV